MPSCQSAATCLGLRLGVGLGSGSGVKGSGKGQGGGGGQGWGHGQGSGWLPERRHQRHLLCDQGPREAGGRAVLAELRGLGAARVR